MNKKNEITDEQILEGLKEREQYRDILKWLKINNINIAENEEKEIEKLKDQVGQLERHGRERAQIIYKDVEQELKANMLKKYIITIDKFIMDILEI